MLRWRWWLGRVGRRWLLVWCWWSGVRRLSIRRVGSIGRLGCVVTATPWIVTVAWWCRGVAWCRRGVARRLGRVGRGSTIARRRFRITGRCSIAGWCSIAGRRRWVTRWWSIARRRGRVAGMCSIAGLLVGSVAIVGLLLLVGHWLLRVRLVSWRLLGVWWRRLLGVRRRLLGVMWRGLLGVLSYSFLRIGGWWCFSVHGRLGRGCVRVISWGRWRSIRVISWGWWSSIGVISWWCVRRGCWRTMRVRGRRTTVMGRLSIMVSRPEASHNVLMLGRREFVLRDSVLHAVHGLGVGETKLGAIYLVQELGRVNEVEAIHQTAK